MNELEQCEVACDECDRTRTVALRDLSDSLRTFDELRIRRWARVELYTELAVACQMEANMLELGDPRIEWLFDRANTLAIRAKTEAA